MRARWLIGIVALAGCGLDPFGESGGVPTNLPTQGAGPYGRLESDDSTPTDEPFVLDDRDAELYDPCALYGAGVRLWFTREVTGAPADDQQIFQVELPSVHALPVADPVLALAADQAWEEGRVLAPGVVDLGGGHLVMFYEGGVANPAIGRADSTDDGATWQKRGAPVLVGATAPSAAFASDRMEVYVTRPGVPGIWRATAIGLAPADLTLEDAPIVVPRPDLEKAFDAVAVRDPAIVIERQPSGRLHWGLFFVGTNADDPDPAASHPSVGYAGSFDGDAWERFGGAAAQLSAPATGPSVVLPPASGLLIFAETKRGRRALAAATNP
ncbi:MAG: hypothetical protein K8W52_18195 [Deltaproteobacteria bacterium]|nr:hypothetical protein [Deltaproteobacteria bacterium]